MNARWRIGEWVVVGEFHRGERVVVLKVAQRDRPGKVVALKLCLDTSEKVVAAFKREIENTLEQPLPGDMPVVLDHGEDEAGRPYFVMPESRDVTKMRKSEKLAVAVTRFLIACAIKLRKQRLMHRDLKPDNVGIEVDANGKEHFVLRDWATMRPMIDANILSSVAGTPGYRAEETVVYGITDECTECHAIGCSLLALLPVPRYLIYWKALLLSVMPFRHLRVRTFEELDDLVRNSRKRFRRLVSRVAGVWKTAIITKWTAIGVVLLGVVLIAALELLLVRREVVYKTEHKEDLEVEKLVDSGGIEYMKGNFEAATNFFGRAMRSPHFKPENFPYCDVMDLYRDSCMWLTNDERRALRKRAMQKRGAARR